MTVDLHTKLFCQILYKGTEFHGENWRNFACFVSSLASSETLTSEFVSIEDKDRHFSVPMCNNVEFED